MISVLYYIFLSVLCLTFMITSFVALIICAPFDPGRKVVHWLTIMMTRFFYGGPIYWPKRIEGKENLDPKKSYVVVINHQAMMDIPTLYQLDFNFRWVSKKEVFRIPFFGQFLWLHGDIAIERGNARVAMQKVVADGCRWISRGVSVAIFPEGTRSKDGEIHRFKAGAFNLAKEANVEILPVVMSGTTTAFKKGMFCWRNKVTLKVLPPIDKETVANTDVKELAELVRTQMVDALNTIRK